MKVHKLEVMVCDWNGETDDYIKGKIEDIIHLFATVVSHEKVEIECFEDDHPLNDKRYQKKAFDEIFNGKVKEIESWADNALEALSAVKASGIVTESDVMDMIELGLSNKPQLSTTRLG